uniref:Uncharacterized protein n=1 Tax=Ciona intestinalis TaxID=7719 RepID=H2Y0L7_CIOIN
MFSGCWSIMLIPHCLIHFYYMPHRRFFNAIVICITQKMFHLRRI